MLPIKTAKTRSLAYFKASVILLVLISACGCSLGRYKMVCFNSSCIQAEVADSEPQRIQGLMNRPSLSWNKGMLFTFPEEARRAFWMKNMQFPLDIIWIDGQKNIVNLTENALPCQGPCLSITSGGNVRFVLEVNSGFIRDNNIKPGDKVFF